MLASRTAVLVQDHGGFDPRRASVLKRVWLRRGLSAADALMVSSTGHVDHWLQSGIVPPKLQTFDVMESSTRMQPMDREQARRVSGVSGDPALLWVGRLDDNKDPLTVLRALAPCFTAHPSARLTMVYASGELESRVREIVDRTPALAGRVRLVGRVDRSQMPAYFSAADVFVLGSHREGSGYAAIEALAFGLLPLLTAIPSFQALTNDGAIGELWTPGDADSLERACERAIGQVGEASRHACRQWFEQTFSWSAIGRRTVSAYQEVVEARRRAVADSRRLPDRPTR
jgi:glycosyltransferase involved in cell wall biosynthesis